MQKTQALPFLCVEEAIKRSKQGLKFQEELSLIIWERARIELSYTRNLKEWKDIVRGKLKPIIDKTKDGTDELILQYIAREAECTSQIHQVIHNEMLAPDSPYVSLQRGIGLNKICGSEEEKLLSDLETQFYQLNKRKRNFEKEIDKRKINIDKMRSGIIQYEEQLSKRSRVTKLRRSTGSSKKIDFLTNRLFMLRKQVEGEREVIQRKEATLIEYMVEMKDPLDVLYKQLTNLHKRRLGLFYGELQKFATIFEKFSLGNKKRGTEIANMVKVFGSVNIDDMIELMEKEIETKAKARRQGHIYELQQMFDSPTRTTENEKKNEFHSHTTMSPCEKMRPSHAASAMGRMETLYATGNSPSDNVLVDTFCTSSSESIKPKHEKILVNNTFANSTFASCGSSEVSLIETIFVPNEPSVISKVLPPFATKEFCVSSEEDCRSDDGAQTKRDSKDQLSVNQNTEDIGMQRNIKVVATHDVVSSKNDQLNLKKGQVIKQKCGENEEGFAYGWVRENRLTPKQYGWYPVGVVKKYVPASDTSVPATNTPDMIYQI